MSAPIDTILPLLPSLNQDQLRQVQSRIQALLSISGRRQPVVSSSPFAGLLYGELSEIQAKRLATRAMPYSVFLKSEYGAAFTTFSERAEQANLGWFPKQTRAQKHSMVRLYAKLIIEFVESQSKPLNWFWICKAVADLAAIVDKSFPGYAQTGLLNFVQDLRTTPASAE